ncbi:MAG: RNA 2',3'-cyclic phosphodiesterase, partial [Limisphaerales bacterium]
LRFFGWITLTKVDELTNLLAPICSAHQPFILNCEGLGTFPNMRRPRVLWAGLKGDIAHAAALQSEITSATRAFGDLPEERPFNPHLTLARLKDQGRDKITDLEYAVARGFQIDQPWHVTQVLLMQSHLSPAGSTYEPLATFKLG